MAGEGEGERRSSNKGTTFLIVLTVRNLNDKQSIVYVKTRFLINIVKR